MYLILVEFGTFCALMNHGNGQRDLFLNSTMYFLMVLVMRVICIDIKLVVCRRETLGSDHVSF